ncbi:MAG: HD domain-containing protein [Lachnospiraceae bacterium]|nr:HD domain-containing protein [Lachnospiraceae bacterium]
MFDIGIQDIIAVLYFLVALIVALVILKAYEKRDVIGKRLGKVMLAAFLLVIFYSFDILEMPILVKTIALSLTCIMADVMMVFFYEYTVELIGWQKKVPRFISIVLWVFAAVDVVLMVVNPVYKYSFDTSSVMVGTSEILQIVPNSGYMYHAGLMFLIIAIVVILLVVKCGETPKMYWRRYGMLIATSLLAVLLKVVALLSAAKLPVDLSPMLYCVMGVIMYYNTFRYLPRVTMDITRKMILEFLSEPIVLFDYEGWLADYSPAIQKLMPDTFFSITRLRIEDFVLQGNFKGFRNNEKDQDFEWSIVFPNETRVYRCKYRIMRDEKKRVIAKIFVFHNITSEMQTYFELEQSTLYDPVTGLYNKQSFMTQMPQWSDRRYWPTALGICNINGLRAINESQGNAYGDMIMQRVSYFVKENVPDQTFVAMIDNGDIVAVMENTPYEDAAAIFERIKAETEAFFGEELDIHMEFGIAVKERDDVTMDHVLTDARASMQNKKMLRDNSASSSLLGSLRQTLSETDYETEEHVERTRVMSARLGQRLGLSDADISRLELLATLHDIGKVAIPQHILTKKSRLNDEEFKIMQQHTVKGYRIAMSSPELRDIAEGILCHHEKWDGTGYPNGYKGEEIPLLARIISCVDSHDVMVNNRPYHQAMPEEKAIAELRRCAGTQFDPYIVDVFTKMLEEEDLPRQREMLDEQKQAAKLAAEQIAKEAVRSNQGRRR